MTSTSTFILQGLWYIEDDVSLDMCTFRCREREWSNCYRVGVTIEEVLWLERYRLVPFEV